MDAMPSSHARASPHAGCASFSFGSSIGCLGLPPGWSDTSLDLRFMLVSDPARRALQLAPKVQPAKSMTRRHCGTDTLHAGLGARLKIQRGSVGSAGFCGASMNEMSSTRRREQRLPIFASVPVPLSAVSPRTTTVDDTRIAANGPVPDRRHDDERASTISWHGFIRSCPRARAHTHAHLSHHCVASRETSMRGGGEGMVERVGRL